MTTDTLSISSIRLRREYPLAKIDAAVPTRPADPENHPHAAAAARARIAALPDLSPFAHLESAPAAPTAELITDRLELADAAGATDTVMGGRPLPPIVQPLLTSAGIFLLTLLLFKAPIIISQINYTFHKPKTPAPITAQAAAVTTAPAANTISIPKINVQAPVIYESSLDNSSIDTALESGVVHYGDTAVPGQVGNVAIFGHSSNDWWEPGNFKFVFVLLDKLAPGDLVTIDYNSTAYTYQVTGSKIVDPTDIAVLDPTSTPTLSLITCSPPGTSLRRLVVTAKQISPDPNQAATATPSAAPAAATTSSLPSAPSTFNSQISQAWNGIVSGFKSLFGAGSSHSSSSPTVSPGATPAGGQLPAAN